MLTAGGANVFDVVVMFDENENENVAQLLRDVAEKVSSGVLAIFEANRGRDGGVAAEVEVDGGGEGKRGVRKSVRIVRINRGIGKVRVEGFGVLDRLVGGEVIFWGGGRLRKRRGGIVAEC